MAPYLYLQIIFFASELGLLIFRRAKSNGISNNRDRRSLLILWVIISLSLTAGPWVAAYGIWEIGDYDRVFFIGMIIFIIGFAVRWMAIYQLGKMFTVNVTITEGHTLKTSGLYKIVRHPSYTGLLLIIAGLGVCLNSWASFLILLVPSFIALNYRITIEEKALTEEFGTQYDNYKRRVKRLIPGMY
jgi:protein-S-isoprenylcysteine O-methyltransferase Ste14